MIDSGIYEKIHPNFGEDHQIAKCDGVGPFELHLWSTDQKLGGGAGLDCWPTFIDTSEMVLAREMYLLLPPTVKGFDMSEKRWGRCFQNQISDLGYIDRSSSHT